MLFPMFSMLYSKMQILQSNIIYSSYSVFNCDNINNFMINLFVSTTSFFVRLYHQYDWIRSITDRLYQIKKSIVFVFSTYKREPTTINKWISTSKLIFKNYKTIYLEEEYEYISNISCQDAVCKFLIDSYDKNVLFENDITHFRERKEEEYLVLLKYDNQYMSRFISKNKIESYDNIRHNQQIIENDTDCKIVPSNVRFITVQYIHPKMKDAVDITIPESFFIVENELLSPSFVLRSLYYQSMDYYFDYDYTVQILDNKINIIELKYNQYIYIDKNNYIVKTI